MKKPFAIVVSCLIGLLMVFSFTDPNKIPSLLLIIPFVLIFVVLLILLLGLFGRQVMSNKRSRVMAGLCASVPVALLVMQSIGQLTVRDVVTIGALFSLAFFYASRTMPKV